jgi:hypothetical protein
MRKPRTGLVVGSTCYGENQDTSPACRATGRNYND